VHKVQLIDRLATSSPANLITLCGPIQKGTEAQGVGANIFDGLARVSRIVEWNLNQQSPILLKVKVPCIKKERKKVKVPTTGALVHSGG
jgi:hypothetical protein